MGEFEERIYSLVEKIPRGCVASYGQLAALAGGRQWARRAGRAVANAGGRNIPCHRVVNSRGETAPFWKEQKALLEAEGVSFSPSGRVVIKKHLWRPLG